MKIILFIYIIMFTFLPKTAYTNDYRFDLINALFRNDFEAIENIINLNINTMSVSDKRVVINIGINYSSGENTLKVLELLLKYNIRPNSFDLFTALDRNRQNSAIQFMLQNGAIPNGEILLLTMKRQRFDLAKQFIEKGVDVNYHYSLSRHDADGMTPLLYASKWENFEMVKLLVENGANINIQAVDGNTALSIAQKNNNERIINYLLEHGAVELIVNNLLENAGIVNMLDNQIFNFQTGTYRLSNGNRSIRFSGNANSGSLNYIDSINIRVINGVYRITGNNMVIILDDNSYNYSLTANESFSGNGEMWVRIGN